MAERYVCAMQTGCHAILYASRQAEGHARDDAAPHSFLDRTGDTKADELLFVSECIARAGGKTIMMDISVLGDPPYQPEHDKRAVATPPTTIEAIASSGDENSAIRH